MGFGIQFSINGQNLQYYKIIQKEIKWPGLIKYERKNANKTLCECKANEEKSLKRTTIMKWANTYAVECSKWQQVHTAKVIEYKSCVECFLLMQCATCMFGRNRVEILEIKSSWKKTIALLLSLVLHYHLEVQTNPPQKNVKKTQFLASMGEMGLSPDIFFRLSLGPFEVIEVKWQSMLDFQAVSSKFCNHSWKFGS